MQACPSRFSRKDCEKTLSAALFIHGLGCSGRSFEHLVDYARADTWFTDRYNVVVFEAPRSLNSPKSTDLIEYLARLAASNVEGEDEVVVVGHSMGGVIGLTLCELLGSKVSHFVNIEGNLTASDCGLISDKLGKNAKEGALGFLMEEFQRKDCRGAGMWCQDVQTYNLQALHQYAIALEEASKNGQLLCRFGALICQKLFLYGDEYLPTKGREENPALSKNIDAKKLHVAGAGHFVMQDEPGYCWNAISTFLQ